MPFRGGNGGVPLQIIIDSLMGKGDLERSREVHDMAVETKKHCT